MNEETTDDLPGLPPERFLTMVDCLVSLRDSGKFLIFLGRNSSTKIVGDLDDFVNDYSTLNGDDIAREMAQEAIDEIQTYCSFWASFQNLDQAVQVMSDYPFSGSRRKRSDEERATLTQHLNSKIKCVSEKLFTNAMTRRLHRIETATLACLEDLDYETVTSRTDSVKGKIIDDAFLRLRLRYSTADDALPFPFIRFPWSPDSSDRAQSFEIECDESDIDLLLIRLQAAKNVLLESQRHDSEPSPE